MAHYDNKLPITKPTPKKVREPVKPYVPETRHV